MRDTIYKYYVYILLFLASFTLICAQSTQDLQNMKDEYEKLKSSKQIDLQQANDRQAIDPRTGVPTQARITPFLPLKEEIKPDSGLQHFGYDFFTRRDSVAFWENLPTPANYLLGPGDELVISLWGETQLRETYTITRDGKIYDQKVGLLNPMGKTIDEAQTHYVELQNCYEI